MSKSRVNPIELTEFDRLAISTAREQLQKYGLYVDVADMSDVAYEQRMCRKLGLELAVSRKNAASAAGNTISGETLAIAQDYYEFIWKGAGNGEAV